MEAISAAARNAADEVVARSNGDALAAIARMKRLGDEMRKAGEHSDITALKKKTPKFDGAYVSSNGGI